VFGKKSTEQYVSETTQRVVYGTIIGGLGLLGILLIAKKKIVDKIKNI